MMPTRFKSVLHGERMTFPDHFSSMWTYDLALVDSAVDLVVGRWYRDTLGEYWLPERAR